MIKKYLVLFLTAFLASTLHCSESPIDVFVANLTNHYITLSTGIHSMPIRPKVCQHFQFTKTAIITMDDNKSTVEISRAAESGDLLVSRVENLIGTHRFPVAIVLLQQYALGIREADVVLQKIAKP